MKTLREELEEILDMGDDVAKEMDITIKGEPTVKVDYIKAVLSRHREEEPLAVLAARKGAGLLIRRDTSENRWAIFRLTKEGLSLAAEAPTYAEAEAKARQYLEGLEDKI